MLPHEDKMSVPELFYCTFKVQKQHKQGKALPTRGILSCSGTLTENNALYVEYKIKHIGQNHKTYWTKPQIIFTRDTRFLALQS